MLDKVLNTTLLFVSNFGNFGNLPWILTNILEQYGRGISQEILNNVPKFQLSLLSPSRVILKTQ